MSVPAFRRVTKSIDSILPVLHVVAGSTTTRTSSHKLTVETTPILNILTPSPRRETGYSTYARSTPPTAQYGPLHTVSDMGVDVHDPRQRCNSEKHPTLSQLFSARSHDPSSCSSRTLSANVTWVCSDRAGKPASASQGQVDGLCRGADHGLEAFRPSLTALGRARGFSRPVCTRRHETAQRPI